MTETATTAETMATAADGAAPITTEATTQTADGEQTAAIEYADFTMPEGLAIDAEVMGDFKGGATEYKLSQEQAQKVADLGVKLHQRWAESLIQDSNAYLDSLFDPSAESKGDMFGGPFKARSEKWAAESKADQEFGGDKLHENLAVIAKAPLRYQIDVPGVIPFSAFKASAPKWVSSPCIN